MKAILHLTITFIGLALVPASASPKPITKIVTYPAPAGEVLNHNYRVAAGAKAVAVYNVKVGAADDNRRFKAVDDLMHSDEYYDNAAFCYFDLQGPATVTVTISSPVLAAKVLPASAGIKVKIHHNSISFTVRSPQNYTVEINHEWVRSLHIFVNPMQTYKPNLKDPNLIYFGPGIHEVTSMVVGDNKTVYIAGGAIIKAVVGKNEPYNIEPSGLHNYPPTFVLAGRNIRFCGRGIIDATPSPTHAKSIVTINGSGISLEGVILKNSSGWTAPIRQSKNVTFNNIKILGYRANTDGIDICNSENVLITNCFVRTNDDLIVIKSWERQGPVKHVIVKNCVLYNQLAHALSVGPELREDVDDVLFTNCDIIHDQGREWSLRIFQGDSTLVKNVRFEDIRIEEAHQLISLWIGKNGSSFNKIPGNIEQIQFKNIHATGSPLLVELAGADPLHLVKNIVFQNVILNGRVMNIKDIRVNEFYKQLTINNLKTGN